MPKRPRNSTSSTTSSFGSPGRVSHDASRLCDDAPRPDTSRYLENAIPSQHLDRIFYAPSERMAELPDSSVHLIELAQTWFEQISPST